MYFLPVTNILPWRYSVPHNSEFWQVLYVCSVFLLFPLRYSVSLSPIFGMGVLHSFLPSGEGSYFSSSSCGEWGGYPHEMFSKLLNILTSIVNVLGWMQEWPIQYIKYLCNWTFLHPAPPFATFQIKISNNDRHYCHEPSTPGMPSLHWFVFYIP